jgi:membrane protein
MKNTGYGTKFKLEHLPSLLKQTYKNWIADDPWRLGAILAYYAVLALPGLLVIIINIVGAIWGREIVQGELTDEISRSIGKEAGDAVEAMMSQTQESDKNLISTIIGVATLIYGATGVFYQLQISLNKIWKISHPATPGILKIITDRARSFAFILALGFLLLVSFIITAALAVLSDYLRRLFPEIVVYIAFTLDLVVSLGIITIVFALIFKYLPDIRIQWKTVWIGSLLTAVLFVIGKLLMGLYFGEADPSTTYGAAGTIVLILLWVSYSSMILFFGAEFTAVYSDRYGLGITTDDSD